MSDLAISSFHIAVNGEVVYLHRRFNHGLACTTAAAAEFAVSRYFPFDAIIIYLLLLLLHQGMTALHPHFGRVQCSHAEQSGL
jgi:hypothetical protein